MGHARGERISAYIVKAGTIIFAAAVGVWALSNFGWATWDGGSGAFGLPGFDGAPGDAMEYSLLKYIGEAVGVIFAPLGFSNWQSASASISALIAKENLVSTFGVLYGLGDASRNPSTCGPHLATCLPMQAAFSTSVPCAHSWRLTCLMLRACRNRYDSPSDGQS